MTYAAVPKVNFKYTRACVEIMNDAFSGQLGSFEAMRLLERYKVLGTYFAGEIFLQKAIDEDSSISSSLLMQSDKQFAKTQQAGSAYNGKPNQLSALALKACHRRLQLKMYEVVHLKKRFPHRNTVSEAYKKILKAGTDFSDLQRVHHSHNGDSTMRTANSMRLGGALSEIAVHSLGLRYSLRNDLASDWLPLQSAPAEDRSVGLGDTKPKTGWDMSVWAPDGHGEDVSTEPTLAYRVQIKSSFATEGEALYDDGISMVYLYPNLALPGEGRFGTAQRIIRECALEYSGQSESSTTDKLDTRTDQLLDVIG